MKNNSQRVSPVSYVRQTAVDLLVTLLLWAYFTLGFVLFFAPFYLFSALFSADRQKAFQRLNTAFYRGFFSLCRMVMPRQAWCIDDRLRHVTASVVVCNHLSYIDPLLLISLYPRHTTIVKNRLFHIPVFSWFLNRSGYLPAASRGRLAQTMNRRLEALPHYLAGGGNLIVFPEGTRSRDGRIGTLNAGAFKIARLCRAPLAVVCIENTDRLFTPEKFLFNTCRANTISVRLLEQIRPDYDSDRFSLKGLMAQVHALLVEKKIEAEKSACPEMA